MTASLSIRLWRESSRFLAGCSSLGLVAEGLTREEATGSLATAVSLLLGKPSPSLELVGPVGDGPWCPSSVSARLLVEKLKAAGFVEVEERDGHLKLAKQGQGEGGIVVVPPTPGNGELAIGTLRAILEQTGIERSELVEAPASVESDDI